ncbi:PorP/SprF family type IX secretion system membrane protein [Aquimarina intermedia]|uniref:Type IX secretion system PorP/SprF family membrane protein n=1 Tax=Aquimarina intermedia TaxID=350814 RepID=A0A5S5CF32_9FLAO|nr:PorP/SprF family type IX secretion system membrane protein [Aquimarina intermedia]TYP76896.1 type IX secretion system PorP/SprF family membrane protein [Aquimarina intermedia]
MIRKLFLLSICCVSLQVAKGQEESTTNYGKLPSDIPTHNLVRYNRFYFNPTFSLVRETKKSINIYNRLQYSTFNDNPQTFLINYTSNFDEKTGVSIGLHQQNEGVYRYFGGVANYAYNLEFGRDMNFTFGLNLGFSQSAIKSNLDEEGANGKFLQNNGNQISDPLIVNYEKSSVFLLSPGVNFNYQQFDVGVAVGNLVAYNITASEILTDNMAFTGHVMYTHSLERRSDKLVRGMVYANMLAEADLRYGANAILELPSLGWAQVGYNSFYGASIGIGANITPNVSVGYTYERGFGDASIFSSTHEVGLAYNFNEDRRRRSSRSRNNRSTSDKAFQARDSEIRRLKKEILQQNKLIRELQEGGNTQQVTEAERAMSRLERSIEEAKEEEARKARELELQREEEVALLNKKAEEEERAARRSRLERETAEQQAEEERLARQSRLERETAEQEEKERLARQSRLERETAEQERLAARSKLEAEMSQKEIEDQQIAKEEAAREAEAAKQEAEAEALAARQRLERETTEQQNEAARQSKLEREVAEQQAEEERVAAQRKLEREVAEQKAEEERVATQRKLEREVAEQQAEEERVATQRKLEREVAEQQAEEERVAAQRKLEREVAEQQAEEERVAAQRKLEREVAEQQEEEERVAAQRKLEREVAEQQAEEERVAAQRKLEREVAEQQAEEERLAVQKKLEMEMAEQKRIEDEAEAARLAEEERLRQEAEAARLAEEERLRQEAEAARLAEEERLRQEAEAARLAEEERLRQEAEAARLAEEERLRQEAEAARLAEEERLRQEAEAARLAEEERLRQEAEAARLAKEERLRQEAEAARLEEEEAARLAAEQEEVVPEDIQEIKEELDNNSRITRKLLARQDSLLSTSTNVDKRDFNKLLESLVSMNDDADEAKRDVDPTSSKRLVAKNKFIKFAETSRPEAQYATKYIPGYEEGFYLIGNVFKGGGYAEKFSDGLKDVGFDNAQIILNPENDLQYVSIANYKTKEEASEKYFSNMDNKFFGDMWVLQIAKSRVASFKRLLQETRTIQETVQDDTVLSETLSYIGGHNVKNGYYLITNIFKRENYFERGMEKLRAQGLEPQYFRNPKDNYIYVYLKRYENLDDAKQGLFSNVNNQYDGDLYILRIQ